MAQPVWVTPAGSLGTIPEGVFYQTPLEAIEPDLGEPVFYKVIAGALPDGIQVTQTGLLSGVPVSTVTVQGIPVEVARDTTSKFAIRSYTTVNGTFNGAVKRLADRTFSLTVTGPNAPEFITPPGQIAQYYDGSLVSALQILYTDPDPGDVVEIRLIAGQLPPGLNISPTGLISGFIAPNTNPGALAGYSRDGQGYDKYPFDFPNRSSSLNYEFVLEVTDGRASNLRAFSIFVWSRDSMTADNIDITSDNTFITADVSPVRVPIILNPEGSIGTVQSDNFFAYQFIGLDLDGDRFEIIGFDLPPGLTLDPNTGWLYGYIPYLGLTENTYNFYLVIYKEVDPAIFSNDYNYSLTITGPIDTNVIWLTDSDLGSIDNGATSTLYVEAVNVDEIPVLYRLKSGSDSRLPQGLQLLSNGLIAGRVSFDTFALDGGTTTFDVGSKIGETTFDMVCRFTVNAYSEDGLVNVFKEFTITVVRRYNEPYDNLYIQAMPPFNDRALIDQLLDDSVIFPSEFIYRAEDPNFGLARNVTYFHAYGLTAATLTAYVSSLYLNHYWKNLVLGQIKTARALDDQGNVIYEVVYSQIIDDLVNNQGQSVDKEVLLPYPIDAGGPEQISSVYPNSLVNMRDQVIDTVGQITNQLPRWMLSTQENGQVLGFTPAWVIAYTKPGRGKQIAYNIQTFYGDQLNQIDYKVDRYEIDRALSKYWDAETKHWVPSPPVFTYFDRLSVPVQWINNFDNIVTWQNNSGFSNVVWSNQVTTGETIFDGGSMQFIDPVDMYANTTGPASQLYDKYLVFPKRNILE